MASWSLGKLVILTIVGSVTLELLYYTWNYFKRNHRHKHGKTKPKQQQKNIFHNVLFFPDQHIACKEHFNSSDGCLRSGCKYAHSETSLTHMLSYLRSARKTLDLCVFVITCHELSDTVIALHERGVTVRVITDDEQVDITGSKIGAFRAAGIQVRQDRSSYLMHHKFALIDEDVLINGSFNWTRQAVTGNNENLLITNSRDIVQPYIEEFERLWEQFDPRNYKCLPHTNSDQIHQAIS
ncbi:mitochondrial cardiolipin hydrolase [Lingula anatina]|uniref:Mitochondrial cardiolipin hydrolase n=1 Tax=Lingula anatina TaxID=7574 RepID=A0A1S3K043_LINAN|nr:mitochondrial cardiolipin hydrolase [Lingula anatina]|eukprot:XP_013415912.1 mitochondrial cardiolipin hydrolase [Lingula anatina]